MDGDVGIVGSPSTTRKVTVDILEDAAGTPLQGDLVYLAHPMDGDVLLALGTVTEIRTSNRWHEDPNMRGVLKRHGSLPHLSGIGDVRTGEILIQAAYAAKSTDPSVGDPPIESGGALSMSPTTGARVSRVTDHFLTQLLRRHRGQLLYLGRIYRSDVRMPVTIRHFGRVGDGGVGEAYHTGIFGMTGSGKSGLAAYLIAAQLRHPEIGVLVIDPQGQFTGEEGLPFSLQEWAEMHGRSVASYSISSDLRLQKDAYLLGDLLGLTRFFRDLLTVRTAENRESAVAEVTRILQGIPQWENQSGDQVLRDLLTTLVNDQPALTRIYASQAARTRFTTAIQGLLTDATQYRLAADLFNPLHSLFTNLNLQGGSRQSIYQVLGGVLDPTTRPRPLVIVDFSSAGQVGTSQILESTEVKGRILQVVCSMLNVRAEQLYHLGTGLNVLVVFDEAHRFAAEDAENEEVQQLSNRLVDYVRTTRKFGLGWMFITQEINSLRRSIYTQLRVRCFGYGLTSGSELQRLREAVGDPSTLELYRSFVDPAAIQPREFPFMITGPISPLSFTGAPLFLSVYTDFSQFKTDNGIAG